MCAGARRGSTCRSLPRFASQSTRSGVSVRCCYSASCCSLQRIPAGRRHGWRGRKEMEQRRQSKPADDQAVRNFRRRRTHDGRDGIASCWSFVCACLAYACSSREGTDRASRDAQNEAIERTRSSLRLALPPLAQLGLARSISQSRRCKDPFHNQYRAPTRAAIPEFSPMLCPLPD